VAFALVVVAIAAPAWGAPSTTPSPQHSLTPSPGDGGSETGTGPKDLVVLSGDVVVRKGEIAGDIVIIHGSARLAGVVRGDVVVIDGPITIGGVIRGDVVALDGDVTLVAGAHVTGDVAVAHGKLTIEVGALIDGRVKRGSLSFLSPSRLVTKLAFWIAISVSTLLLGLVLLLLAPRSGDAVALAGREAVGASIGLGAAAVFGLPVAAVLLLVTLVGIPFGIGLLLGLALLYSIGYAYAAVVVGRLLIRPSRHGGSRVLAAFLAGWAILRIVGFVPVLGGITWFLAAWYGLGAVIVAIWRARRAPVPRLEPDRAEPGFTTAAVPPLALHDQLAPGPAPDVPPFTEPAPGPPPDVPPYAEPAH
jgi:hypothetical protein